MSFASLGELNWLAVVVGTVIYYAIGALWYSQKAFGPRWMKSIGWTPSPNREPSSAAFYKLDQMTWFVISGGYAAVGIIISSIILAV